MVSIDYYTSAGYALELLALSKYHQQFELGNYFCTEILPPLFSNQARFYVTSEGLPTGMVTWAWLSEDIERDVHLTGRALGHEEWSRGDRLFFNDWITPYGNTREAVYDMTYNLFPNHVATSLRRRHDGSVHSISRWNLRRKQEEA